VSTTAFRRAARALEIVAGLCLLSVIVVESTGGLALGAISLRDPRNPWRLFMIAAAARLLMGAPGAVRRAGAALRRNPAVAAPAALLLALACAVRLPDLAASSLNGDEILWMLRGDRVVEKLAQGEYIAATDNLVHPGLIEALSIGLSRRWLARGGGGLGVMDPVAAARLPMALLGALACPALFLLGRRIWSTRVALAAGLFLALDPVHIGLSRMAHLDGALTFFFMLTCLSYAVAEIENDGRWKALAGVWLGCALLTKLPAFVIPALLLAWKAAAWLRGGRPRGPLVTAGDAAFVALGYVIYVGGFTRLWLDPSVNYWFRSAKGFPPYEIVHAAAPFLRRVPVAECAAALYLAAAWRQWRRGAGPRRWSGFPVWARQSWGWAGVALLAVLAVRFAPHAVENTLILLFRVGRMGVSGEEALEGIPMGSVHASWVFYPLLLGTRLTEPLVIAAVIGLGASLWRFAAERRSAAAALLPLAAALGFVAIMTPGRRAAMRYILPATPFVCVLGGMGLAALGAGLARARGLWRRLPSGRVADAAVLLLAAALHVPAAIAFFPNYYLYFNSFIGGPRRAARHVMVGWGEGQKEAAAFLVRAAGGGAVNVAVLGETGTLRYYWEHAVPPPAGRGNIGTRPVEEADYVVLPLNVRQRLPRHSLVRRVAGSKPAHVVRLNGVDVIEIYPHRRRPVRGEAGYGAASRITDWTTGRREGDPALGGKLVRGAVPGRDGEGWLFRGPYRTYAPGGYVAEFRVRTGPAPSAGEIAVLDVSADEGGEVLASRTLTAADFPEPEKYAAFCLAFVLREPREMEFRVYYLARAPLWVYRVNVAPAAPEP